MSEAASRDWSGLSLGRGIVGALGALGSLEIRVQEIALLVWSGASVLDGCSGIA